MTITDKIKNVITAHRLTPSHFADEIGVQRSSISHILSGRNRPSLEIVQRIVGRFPEITYSWLLEDDNTGSVDKEVSSVEVPAVSNKITSIKNSRSKLNTLQPEESRNTILSAESGREQSPRMPERTIEKILIFYSDNTYTEYTPSSKNSSSGIH